MLSELADAVLSCAVPITVTRFGEPEIVKGRKVGQPEKETFETLASVQPATQEELKRLPEGSRVEGAVTVFVVTELRTLNEDTGEAADTFLYGGVDYQVKVVDNWFDFGGYYQLMATRLD